MAHRVLKLLPVYATGIGFVVALVAVADARKWSDVTTGLVGIGVAAFYVVLILVPGLLRDQRLAARQSRSGHYGANGSAGAATMTIVALKHERATYGPSYREPARERVRVGS